MKVAILGAGVFGTALGGILTENGCDVSYYDPKIYNNALSDVVNGAKYIVLCVPSDVAPQLLRDIPKNIPLIIATKGFLSGDLFADFDDYMILSGPGFADDIKAKKKTKLTSTDKQIEKLFTTDYLSFDYTDDERGVLMCGALKNIYALRSGLLELEPGTKEFNSYIKNVVNEMKDILEINGANSHTVDLSCGVGDLEITCYYPSRNYEFGRILKENPSAKPEKTVESISALKLIKNGKIKLPESATILNELIEISNKWD